jgi:hypothetical protein
MRKTIQKSKGGKRPGAGRPATGTDPVRTIRLSDDLMTRIEAWSTLQRDEPGRSEAIRRLVELGLTVKRPKSPSPKAAARAAELAATTIDRRIDPKAPPQEREVRKRELIEGPRPFRDARKDRPEK